MNLTGSTSRTIILLASLGCVTFLTYQGSVDAQAFVAIVSLVLGGVVHAAGTRQGSEVSGNTTPPDA